MPDRSELSKLSHAELMMLRDMWPAGEAQRLLAPYEHEAFAREWVRENPVVAVPALAGAIPGYQLAKLLGLADEDATPASLEQMMAGYKGVGQGMRR